MHILLDTHVLLWSLTDDPKLDETAREAINGSDNIVFVSLATLWELQIKRSIGKINFTDEVFQVWKPAGYELLTVTLEHIIMLDSLPWHHRDPFDRMLVAQASHEQLLLITCDRDIQKYDIQYLNV